MFDKIIHKGSACFIHYAYTNICIFYLYKIQVGTLLAALLNSMYGFAERLLRHRLPIILSHRTA